MRPSVLWNIHEHKGELPCILRGFLMLYVFYITTTPYIRARIRDLLLRSIRATQKKDSSLSKLFEYTSCMDISYWTLPQQAHPSVLQAPAILSRPSPQQALQASVYKCTIIMQNSQHSQGFTLKNTDRSTNWALSNFRDWAKKKNINPTQEAMVHGCSTWKNSLQNMVKTMCATALQWELLRATSATEMFKREQERTGHRSLEALRVYERSSAEHKAASTILSTKQKTFQQQMVGPEQDTASTKPNVTVPAFSFHSLQNCTINITMRCYKELIIQCIILPPW